MKIRTAYGNVIRNARVEKGLSLREASSRAHISLSYLSEVETGKKEASSEYLGAILSVLDIPPVEFFTRVANQYKPRTLRAVA